MPISNPSCLEISDLDYRTCCILNIPKKERVAGKPRAEVAGKEPIRRPDLAAPTSPSREALVFRARKGNRPRSCSSVCGAQTRPVEDGKGI